MIRPSTIQRGARADAASRSSSADVPEPAPSPAAWPLARLDKRVVPLPRLAVAPRWDNRRGELRDGYRCVWARRRPVLRGARLGVLRGGRSRRGGDGARGRLRAGALVAELARAVGAERVAGVEPSEPLLVKARAAAPDVDLRLAGAESLPFDDGAFDLVLSQFVVNFVPDPRRGVSEMRRVAGQRWRPVSGTTPAR